MWKLTLFPNSTREWGARTVLTSYWVKVVWQSNPTSARDHLVVAEWLFKRNLEIWLTFQSCTISSDRGGEFLQTGHRKLADPPYGVRGQYVQSIKKIYFRFLHSILKRFTMSKKFHYLLMASTGWGGEYVQSINKSYFRSLHSILKRFTTSKKF